MTEKHLGHYPVYICEIEDRDIGEETSQDLSLESFSYGALTLSESFFQFSSQKKRFYFPMYSIIDISKNSFYNIPPLFSTSIMLKYREEKKAKILIITGYKKIVNGVFAFIEYKLFPDRLAQTKSSVLSEDKVISEAKKLKKIMMYITGLSDRNLKLLQSKQEQINFKLLLLLSQGDYSDKELAAILDISLDTVLSEKEKLKCLNYIYPDNALTDYGYDKLEDLKKKMGVH